MKTPTTTGVRILGGVLLAVFLPLGVAACGSDAPKASNAKCTEVANALDSARHKLGTAEGPERNNAKDEVKSLELRQKECAANGSSSTAAQPALDNAPTTVDADLLKALTIGAGAHPCTQYAAGNQIKDGVAVPDLGFRVSVADGGRLWADALSTPLAGGTDAELFRSVAYKVCSDPVVGYSYGNMLYGIRLGNSDKTIGGLNSSWLVPDKTDQITPWAAKALPYMGTSGLTDVQVQEAIKQWRSYQDYAAKIVELLSKFNNKGVHSPQSQANWHFASSGMQSGIPNVELNSVQESLPALVLAVTNKGSTCELARVGANKQDARPETFEPQGCAPAPPSAGPPATTSPPGKGGGCTANCGGGNGCDSNCGPTTKTSPPCVCVDKTQVRQPPAAPPKQNGNVPTQAPPPPPARTHGPPVTGPPAPVDTETHTAPIPQPTGGPFG
jgi:hypothetical protein